MQVNAGYITENRLYMSIYINSNANTPKFDTESLKKRMKLLKKIMR